MSTAQKYVGRSSYATTPARGHSYRTQVYLLVVNIARQSGQPEAEVWKWIYDQVHALYGIYLPGLPRRKRESLLRVAERYDVLDKIYLVAQAEKIKYQRTEESELD